MDDTISSNIGEARGEAKGKEEMDTFCRICSSHFKGWLVRVETLVDYIMCTEYPCTAVQLL